MLAQKINAVGQGDPISATVLQELSAKTSLLNDQLSITVQVQAPGDTPPDAEAASAPETLELDTAAQTMERHNKAFAALLKSVEQGKVLRGRA